jgi:RNA polymerase sigma-70 factor (ECF subfamily)
MSPSVSTQETLPAREPEVTESTGGDQNWLALVESIQRDESHGMEELYRVFSRGVRIYLCRQLGPQDLDDKVHDTFLIVVQAIKSCELREPDRLMGFVRTVVRRQVVAQIDRAVKTRREQTDCDIGIIVSDPRQSPEQAAIQRQHEQIAGEVLKSISERDRDILTRFYLREQTEAEICEGMNLSETQFRLLKSRAKARFGELGKKSLGRRRLLRIN